jgi:hypothetical protein
MKHQNGGSLFNRLCAHLSQELIEPERSPNNLQSYSLLPPALAHATPLLLLQPTSLRLARTGRSWVALAWVG